MISILMYYKLLVLITVYKNWNNPKKVWITITTFVYFETFWFI